MFEQLKEIGNKKVWGEHSLTIGAIGAFLIGVVLIVLQPLGSWSRWVGFAVIFAGLALF